MKKLITPLIILIVLASFFVALNAYMYRQKQVPPTYEPYRATLSGTVVCLPHKDTTGPQTKECAQGLRTDSGEHYVLDTMLMSQTHPTLQSGSRISGSGVVTPIERLSSDQWQKYAVIGIFSVTDSLTVEKESVAPAPSKPIPPPITKKCYVGGCSSQLCSDTPAMASTCEYRESYACYQNARCEVQQSGECGWTESPSLIACIENAR